MEENINMADTAALVTCVRGVNAILRVTEVLAVLYGVKLLVRRLDFYGKV
jgi:hypothetical protein